MCHEAGSFPTLQFDSWDQSNSAVAVHSGSPEEASLKGRSQST